MKVNDTATLRKKLQTWQKRLALAQFPEFHYTLKQFWNFLEKNPVLAPICDQLEGRTSPPPYHNWDGMLAPFFIRHFEQEKIFFPDEQDHNPHLVVSAVQDAPYFGIDNGGGCFRMFAGDQVMNQSFQNLLVGVCHDRDSHSQ